MTQKDASYHEAAIQYNRELAEFADDLATRLGHEEVQKWSKAVAKQHKFHQGRHQRALDKLTSATEETEDGGEGTNVSIAEQQAQFAAEQTAAGPDASQAAEPVGSGA